MTDWRRKHLDDLACAVKRYSSRAGMLAPTHRESLEEIYQRAKRFPSSPQGGAAATNSGQIVVALCDVCKEIGAYACQGREIWSQPCRLIASMSYPTSQ